MSAGPQLPPPAASALRAWLELLRLPNLLTVPGDPLAGGLLAAGAAGGAAAWPWTAAAASLLFYTAGLLMNDLADREADLRERPGRPLPSGRVAPSHALAALVLCMAAGEAAALAAGPATAWCGLLLVASIVAYNLRAKRSPIAGPLCMGLCRSLSVVLGASAVPGSLSPVVLAASGLVGLYIAAVTALARGETGGAPGPLRVWMPAIMLVGGSILYAMTAASQSPHEAARAAGTFFVACAAAVYAAALGARPRPRRSGPHVPAVIGLYIGVLLFVQAGFAVSSGVRPEGLAAAMILFALWPLNRIAARRFHAS
jgi:4-hydroxybenzoate polyprenyltransferase